MNETPTKEEIRKVQTYFSRKGHQSRTKADWKKFSMAGNKRRWDNYYRRKAEEQRKILANMSKKA